MEESKIANETIWVVSFGFQFCEVAKMGSLEKSAFIYFLFFSPTFVMEPKRDDHLVMI
jgi:hypothetical protein